MQFNVFHYNNNRHLTATILKEEWPDVALLNGTSNINTYKNRR